jgi:hypothetical protein
MLLGETTLRSALMSGILLLRSLRSGKSVRVGGDEGGGDGANKKADVVGAPPAAALHVRGPIPAVPDANAMRPASRMRPLQNIQFRDLTAGARAVFGCEEQVGEGRVVLMNNDTVPVPRIAAPLRDTRFASVSAGLRAGGVQGSHGGDSASLFFLSDTNDLINSAVPQPSTSSPVDTSRRKVSASHRKCHDQ